MKSIDLFLGVKAEQTLRDALRVAAEESPEGTSGSELCPVGKKDWIAGRRFSSPVEFAKLEEIRKLTLKSLIDLKSYQRIRSENLRIYAVRKPVPVFKDPLSKDFEPIEEERAQAEKEKAQAKKETITCPVCGATVHNYNAQYAPSGKIVGCYLCRGEAPNHKG